MPEFNTDYLRFDAESMKEVIKRKLAENENFTDYLFEDSNITTLIDVFSWTYEALMYYINHGASESIFVDTQLYENMNRIVKMLGYNPTGYSTPQINGIFISRDQTENLFDDSDILQKIIPKYSYIDTTLTDDDGESIYYSLINNVFITPTETVVDGTTILTMPSTSETSIAFYNGRWKLYDKTFLSSGIPFEEFVLDLINIEDEDDPSFKRVAHPFIDVYVKRLISNTEYEYVYFKPVQQGTLFGNNNSVNSPKDNIYELRINEKKQYTIKFGDGIHGNRIFEGDEIYVVYLQSNGPDGEIGQTVLNTDTTLGTGIAGMTNSLYSEFINISDSDIISSAELEKLYVSGVNSSTTFSKLESVDEIRTNAPNWFKMGGRLVTNNDFKTYVMSQYKKDIIDVHVMNNWSYLSEFMAWLYDLGKLDINTLFNLGYVYADSCDFNNVYIWTKFKIDEISKDEILNDMLTIKTLTSEPILYDALNVEFCPCHTAFNGETLRYSIDDWDPNIENYIEITKDPNSLVTALKIKENVIKAITNFFLKDYSKIGQSVNINLLQNNIMNIDGVKTIKTAFLVNGAESHTVKYFDGLSFALWTPTLVNGEDLVVSKGNVKLKNFQFPKLLRDSSLKLSERVKVVYESFGAPQIEY